jgi:hypothetical protein
MSVFDADCCAVLRLPKGKTQPANNIADRATSSSPVVVYGGAVVAVLSKIRGSVSLLVLEPMHMIFD